MDELTKGKRERIMNMSPAGDCNFPSYYVITIIITLVLWHIIEKTTVTKIVVYTVLPFYTEFAYKSRLLDLCDCYSP